MFTNILLLVILLFGSCFAQTDKYHDILSELFDTNMTLTGTWRAATIKIDPAPSNPAPVSPKPSIPENVTPKPKPIIDSPHSYKSCGKGKECVRKYFCSEGKMNVDGGTVFDIRFDGESVCDFLETCCAVEDKLNEAIITSIDTPDGCGYRNLGGVGFKIEGNYNNEAEFGEFPWMVAILRVEAVLDMIVYVYQCGGSLITPDVVLTAAHCVQHRPPNHFKARAGEWESNSKNELLPHQDRHVLEISIHEHYNNRNLQNDIALMFLDSPFEMAANVKTICLPPPGSNFDLAHCYASGWGKDKFEKGRYQNFLKKVYLPVVPNSQCQAYLRHTRLSKYFQLHSSFMCAGGERGKDTCTGDGGSPLFCPIENHPNRFQQVGIVAWGIGCGQENVPGVYVNVPKFRRWIDEKLASKMIDSSYLKI